MKMNSEVWKSSSYPLQFHPTGHGGDGYSIQRRMGNLESPILFWDEASSSYLLRVMGYINNHDAFPAFSSVSRDILYRQVVRAPKK
jgi:hypothetical protein